MEGIRGRDITLTELGGELHGERKERSRYFKQSPGLNGYIVLVYSLSYAYTRVMAATFEPSLILQLVAEGRNSGLDDFMLIAGRS